MLKRRIKEDYNDSIISTEYGVSHWYIRWEKDMLLI